MIEISDDAEVSEVLQENHYYPFGMSMDGQWMANAGREDKYQYNGKELHDDFGLGWYAYGARFYDPVIGRFTGVDPISDQFPWATVYNYAENKPINSIDLHGLQAVISITQIAKNSNGETYVVRNKEVKRPENGDYDHYYTVYSNSDKYGKRGRLEIIENLDNQASFSKFTLSLKDRVSNFLDGQEGEIEVNGGIEFSLSFGEGQENRFSENAEIGENIDDLLSAFGIANSTTSVPVKNGVADIFSFINDALQNAATLSDKMGLIELDKETRGSSDSLICPVCEQKQDSAHIDRVSGFGTYNREKKKNEN